MTWQKQQDLKSTELCKMVYVLIKMTAMAKQHVEIKIPIYGILNQYFFAKTR